ncbi:ankyrin repeat domain-containing protein [Burkholderia cenocepacia]|uniref:ankyrin repeat domain-containing protein n=1 Tax=Burkholderia cenocepacia TaxID=95486 RepID=UPI002238A074|nr:ankyrin repeat domain-containing protein [Burkholderia cenocepacia]MCW5156350.1 ankyrin repeat domain-containing protein [Burkholderia cenocepacia]
MADKQPIPKKHKIVGGVIVGAVVLAVASNFIHPFSAKEVAIDTAKGAGKLALEKGKEKLADLKAQHDAKVAANQASQVAPGAIVAPDPSSNNNLKNVESTQFISIDNVPVKSDNADTMLMNAIESGDIDRVKYLLESGVSPVFTDNEVCSAYIDRSGGEDFRSFEKQSVKLPKDVVDMKTFIAVNSAKKPLLITSKCSKLFLIKSAEKLNVNYNQDEFPYYNRAYLPNTDATIIQQDKDKIAQETKREEIYHLILSKTPDKDMYQLPYVFLNGKAPYSIRKEALDKYMSFGGNFPATQSRAAFLKMYDDAATQLMTEAPNNKQLMESVSYFKNPWNVFFANETSRLIAYATNLQSSIRSLKSTYDVDKKYHSDVANLEIPNLTVDSLTTGGLKYTESSNSILWYYGIGKPKKMIDKYDFQIPYQLNNEIKLLTSIVESKKINLNAQDLQGNSILHYIAGLAGDARPQAIVTRYLLNSGVNANLMNKSGKTAFMIAQDKQSQNDAGWGEISKAYSDKNYN